MSEKQRFTVTLPTDQHRSLAKKKKETGVSIAAHIRLAIAEYLKEDYNGESN